MKPATNRIIFILLLLAVLQAKDGFPHVGGVKLGVARNWVEVNERLAGREIARVIYGFVGSGFIQFRLHPWFSIGFEMMANQKASTYLEHFVVEASPSSYDRLVNMSLFFVDFPVLLYLHLDKVTDIYAGPYLGQLLTARNWDSFNQQDLELDRSPQQGMVVGTLFHFSKLIVDLRYTISRKGFLVSRHSERSRQFILMLVYEVK